MRKHSKLGASSAERWMNCPGSVALIDRVGVKATSAYADEGTAAHELGETCLADIVAPHDLIGRSITVNREIEDGSGTRTESSTWEVTEEMADAVKVYVDYVEERNMANGKCQRLLEQTFDVSHLSPGMFGSADCVLIGVDGGAVLEVIDYKHGAGVVVDVEDNEQLMYYAYGAYHSLAKEARRGLRKVMLTVVQPRAKTGEKIKSITYTVVDVLEFATRLQDAAARTLAPDAPLVPGDWCRWCAAKGECPGLRRQATEIAGIAFDDNNQLIESPEIIAPQRVSPEDIARFLDASEVVKMWMDAVWERAMQMAQSGSPPPGWVLVEKRGTRRWNQIKELEAWVQGDLKMPAEVLYETDLRSPAKLEKLLPKEHREKMNEFTITMSSGNTLAREGTKRKVISTGAADVFDTIKPE